MGLFYMSLQSDYWESWANDSFSQLKGGNDLFRPFKGVRETRPPLTWGSDTRPHKKSMI